MSDRRLDPVSGDFVSAPGGAFESCADVDNMVAFSFSIAVGSWEGDPELGHRFDELANAIDTQEDRNRLRDLAALAVAWIVKLGLLAKVETFAESLGGGAVAFEVDLYKPNVKLPTKAGPFLVPIGVT